MSFFGNKKSDSTTATSQQQQQQVPSAAATDEFTQQKLESNPQTEFESDTAVTDFERRSNESNEHMHQQEIDDAKAAVAEGDVVVDAEGNVVKKATKAGENVAAGPKTKIGAAMKKAAALVPGSGAGEAQEEEEEAKLGKESAAWETK